MAILIGLAALFEDSALILNTVSDVLRRLRTDQNVAFATAQTKPVLSCLACWLPRRDSMSFCDKLYATN
jgi:hypothetical protein